MTRVVIADDHPAFVLGLRFSLSDTFEVVGTAYDGEALVSVVLATRPDAVITDVRMPKRSGIDACRQIRASIPDCAIIMLSTFSDPATIEAAREAGARAYVSKDVPVEALHGIVRRLIDQPELQLIPHVSVPVLTPRERDVLGLMAGGLSNPEIARLLGIGHETVKDHCSGLFTKLDVKDRMSAVSAARHLGLISD